MVSVSPLSTRDLVERRELASDSSVHMSSRLYRERERDSNMGPLVCVGHLANNSLPADHSSYNRHQENQFWAKKWLRYPVEIDSPWYDIPGSHTPERLTHMGNGMIPSVPGYHTPGRLTRQDIISRGDLKFWINRRILDQNRTYYSIINWSLA